jgi:hypothetical protein
MPSKASADTKLTLSSAIKTEVLTLLESTGKALVEIQLLNLCNKNTSLLGTPYCKSDPTSRSGLRRRAVQKYFDYLKNQSAVQYLQILTQFSVAPSKHTKSLVKQESYRQSPDPNSATRPSQPAHHSRRQEASATTEDYNSDNNSNEGEENNSDNSTETNKPPTEVLPSFDRMSICDGPKTPTRSSPFMQMGITSPSPFAASASRGEAMMDGIYNIPPPEEQQDGTLGNPYTIHANLNAMERNSGFELNFVNEVVYNLKKYRVIEIRHPIMLHDAKEWKAVICSERIPELYQNRAIMISGPSVDEFSLDNVKSAAKYHADNPEIVCANSVSARGSHLVAIGKSSDRKRNYYLLLFPEGCILDNSVFCNDTTLIKRFRKDMVKNHPTHQNRTYTGSFAIWRIALRGGMEVAEEEAVESDPAYD